MIFQSDTKTKAWNTQKLHIDIIEHFRNKTQHKKIDQIILDKLISIIQANFEVENHLTGERNIAVSRNRF